MSRAGIVFLTLALMAAAAAYGADTFSIPAWLQPYPGADEEIRTSPGTAVATYETFVSVGEVVAFHRRLFAAQKIPFEAEMYGTTAVIRANVEGCGITIQIRQKRSGSFVQITANERPVIPKVTESDIRRSMEKYDQPVYPAPKRPLPPLEWPEWLAAYGAQASPIRNSVDRFRNHYLESEFDSTEEKGAVQAFYSDLFKAHDYGVTLESSPITPPGKPAIVEGTHMFEHSGRFVIRVDLTPTERGLHVAMRITARQ